MLSSAAAHDQTVAFVQRSHIAAPAAPRSLTVNASSRTVVALRWADAASNESGYQIERCLGIDCAAFEVVGTTAANVIMYFDTGVKRDTLYTYRVRASSTGGHSSYSSGVNLRTLP